jgi:hypothetical protein
MSLPRSVTGIALPFSFFFFAVCLSCSELNSTTGKCSSGGTKWHSTHCCLQDLLPILGGIQRGNPIHDIKSTVWKGVQSLFIGIFIIFYVKNPLSCIGAGITIIVCRGIYIYSTGKNSQGCYRHARTLRYWQWNVTALFHNSAWIQWVDFNISLVSAKP